jgi:hypothetical protein
MTSFDIFFEDGTLQNYVKEKTFDPWLGTLYEGYLHLSGTQMGAFGEILVSKIMEKRCSDVCPRTNIGHDRIIDGYNTEIKFSLSRRKDYFTFNHLACHKDWERLILLGVNPDNHFRMNWIYKEDFMANINSNKRIFKHQQGGESGKNDDYMFASNYSFLEDSGILQGMDTWLNDGVKKMGIELWM